MCVSVCPARATSQIWERVGKIAGSKTLDALSNGALPVSHRAPRSRKNRLVVESLPIEDVFVWCTLFLRRYIHRVSSRFWPSPLTHQDAARIAQRLLLTSSPMAKSQKKPGGGAPCRYSDYMGRRPPGFFWLFAIGDLVSNKPCAILAASWVSGDGQCRDETQ